MLQLNLHDTAEIVLHVVRIGIVVQGRWTGRGSRVSMPAPCVTGICG